MPTTRSKAAKKLGKFKKDEKNRQDAIVAENPRPAFETFTADITLQEGLSVVRSLGGGKYEIVNLKHVDPDLISSEETGRMIKEDPERLRNIQLDDKDWELAKFKCGQAVSSANVQIFRFKKLPLELRYEVYRLVIKASKPLHISGEPDKTLGFALMRTCRQIYEETLPFFYGNTFSISDISPKLKVMLPDLQKKLREVTFEWWGYKIKDPATLRMFLELSNLKVLHIRITKYCAPDVADPYARRQWQYQGDDTIKKFNKTNGFDNLVQLRGLDRVTVRKSAFRPAENVSDQEMADFEAFLMRVLTQPKPKKQRSKRITRSSKVKKGVKSEKFDKDDDEADKDYRP